MLLVNDLAPGGSSGAEVHLALLVEGLRRAGDDVDVFSRPARTGAARLADVWDPAARRALAARAREVRPDVVHAHNVVRELSVSVLGAVPDVPRVLTVHDGRLLGDADGRGHLLRAYQRGRAPFDAAVARRNVDRVLAVSQSLAERMRAAGFRAVEHAAPWAADPVEAPSDPASSRDLVFLGRLDPDKGVRQLVAAFAATRGGRLLLAGSGSCAAELAASPPVREGRAVLLGSLDRAQVSRLLGSARAVVLPSLPARRPEGSPLALIEGLVHGRPLVVSDDPGCVALTRDGRAGLVTPAGDIAALTGALQQLLDDDALVARLAAGAASVAPEHREAAGVGRVRRAYAAVVPSSA